MNYSKELEKKIEEYKKSGAKPKLLLHACCAPCSSYVLEYLSEVFDITLYFYNPNISPEKEYVFRSAELIRLVGEMGLSIKVVIEKYSPKEFFEIANGLESQKEGGERCFKCYELRLRKAGEYAKENGFDYFTTTLSISPYKNAEALNEIGGRVAEAKGVKYLFSDFKKKNGYKRSIELSKEYSLYRQNYCGCIFSKTAAE